MSSLPIALANNAELIRQRTARARATPVDYSPRYVQNDSFYYFGRYHRNALYVPEAHISGLIRYAAQIMVPDNETHTAWTNARNDAVETSYEVCNITGRGAIDGCWVMTSGFVAQAEGQMSCRHTVEVIVDGTDIIDSDFEISFTFPNPSENRVFCTHVGIIGSSSWAPMVDGSGNDVLAYPKFSRASAPIPFDTSLVINLVHLETDTNSGGSVDRMTTRCSASVWETA